MAVNGHVMGGEIGLVYVTPQWFDESMLHSPTRRLAANVVLQFDVLPLQDFWRPRIFLCLCVNAIQFIAHTFVNFFPKNEHSEHHPGDMKKCCRKPVSARIINSVPDEVRQSIPFTHILHSTGDW